ncbi:MAG: hypothetical protein ACT4OO_10080 [Nitrospiraceae bacterium]
MTRMRPIVQGCAALLIGVLWGCALFSTAPSPTEPFFVAASGDVKLLQALARRQDALASKCVDRQSCDHVYFTRALINLYESREAAAKSFHRVIAVAPKSRLAGSSALWIRLLQTVPTTPQSLDEQELLLVQTAERLVRDLLDREVAIQQLRVMKDTESSSVESLQRELNERDKQVEELSTKKDQAKSTVIEPATVQALQRQIGDRDKRIEELSSQLEALKRIDQEMREKTKPIRPPTAGGAPPMGNDKRP